MRRQTPGLGADRRGLSQVVGIALLIAIVVVLVAIAGSYLLDFGSQTEDPAPGFVAETDIDAEMDANGQYLNLTHKGGRIIDTDRIYVDVRGATYVDTSNPSDTGDVEYTGSVIQTHAGDEFKSSETLSLDRRAFVEADTEDPLTGATHLNLTGATVYIYWETGDGSRTTPIYTCEVQPSGCVNRGKG